jgi:GrpB-like predicted nucleotidyltransferase (UPF0157 family)
MRLGLRTGTLKLAPHDPAWAKAFLEEKARIEDALGDSIIAIEHIGSTAIPGMRAKPIIDMAIALENYEDGFDCVKPLEALGYEYRGEAGVPGRHYLRTAEENVKFHIHMFPESSREWADHILFRDYLRANPGEAARYDELKSALLKEFPEDRPRYTEGKAAFCGEIIEKARNQNL